MRKRLTYATGILLTLSTCSAFAAKVEDGHKTSNNMSSAQSLQNNGAAKYWITDILLPNLQDQAIKDVLIKSIDSTAPNFTRRLQHTLLSGDIYKTQEVLASASDLMIKAVSKGGGELKCKECNVSQDLILWYPGQAVIWVSPGAVIYQRVAIGATDTMKEPIHLIDFTKRTLENDRLVLAISKKYSK